MDLDTLKALGAVAGYPLAACLLIWFIGPSLRDALKAKAATWKVKEAGKAVEDLNGKLIAAVSRALEQQQRNVVDTRLGELGIAAQQDEQCDRLRNLEIEQGKQGKSLARIEGHLGIGLNKEA